MQNHFHQQLRIGTRGSPLALAQTHAVIARLKEVFPELNDSKAIEIIILKASGDHILGSKEERLVDIGGKGLFTKELEEALIDKRIDMAVHSMKDVPTWLPDGLIIAAVLEREDPHDAFISLSAKSVGALPQGALVGTSSLRRQAQLLNLRPDLKIVPLRGNVETRIKKLEDGQVQATLLAYAGLKRIGLGEKATQILEPDTLLPAVAQGIVGLQIRQADEQLQAMLSHISCTMTMSVLNAERAMLEVLDGNCHTPIAGLAVHESDMLVLKGLVAHPDGKGVWQSTEKASTSDAVNLGRELGRSLRKIVPAGILPE